MDQNTMLTEHPDLQELRSRYERVSETPTARLLDGATMLAGVYVAISPWVITFAPVHSAVAISNLICGLAVAVLTIGFVTVNGRMHNLAWTTPCFGIWIIISPWVIAGASAGLGMILTNVITGGILTLLGAGIVTLGMRQQQ